MMRLTPASLFGLGMSVLAWIAATGAYGWLVGLVVSVVAYPVGIAAYGIARFGGSRVGDAIGALLERRRSR